MGEQAVERLDWLLSAIADPSGLTVGDLERRYDISQWRNWSLDDELRMIRGEGHIKRPFTVAARGEIDDAATAVVVGADEKSFQVTVWAEERPPHRIVGLRVVPAPPEGLTVRDATDAEAAVLTTLERRSPIKLGDTLMYFDRGDDYFAAARLMGEVTVYVGEMDGAIAGVYWGAQQPVLVNGEPKVLFLENRVRIDPESRRGGVFWALCVYGRDRYAVPSDSIAFYVSPDNAGVQKFVADTPSWTVQPLRVLLPCAGEASVRPRRATKDDAGEVVEILNATHDCEALYVPYTVESLTARLERDPGQYSWSDLRLEDGAVVGVGRQYVEVTKVTGGERVRTNRAVVLDHGGSGDAYRSLLQATGAELSADGVTHLSLFTSAGSSTLDVLTELAEVTEPYDFWAFNIECPDDLPTTGFYVDPVYF